NQAQNRPVGAVGEVRKFPHEPATTLCNTRSPKKKPQLRRVGVLSMVASRNMKTRANSLPALRFSVKRD
ncbi:MAG TPA: hypothetical protein PLT54_06235, partial [Rhodoferax sp.]|nr:hypothetical protein [Rhodoferax sp.]